MISEERIQWPDMPGKNKKKRNSKDSTGSGNGKKKGGGGKSKKKGAGGGGGSGKSSKFQGDIFNEGAMENAYYVCHNVQVISVASHC